MFQLLQPIWLFTIAGIAIPIIIHLWNIRKGKTLQVGSILLLQESATQQARSLRFTDILLLILRCIIIIILAFLLAKPLWKKQLTTSNEKGWVMMEKQSIKEAYKNFKPAIDTLIKAGYKFHYFNKGFVQDNFENALKNNIDSTSANGISYSGLLKQLNVEVPADLPVYLFTDNRLKKFGGARPEVSMNLKWSTYTSEDTISKSLVKAYKISDDSIRIITATSKPVTTFYRSENISVHGSNQYKIIKSDGKKFISSESNELELDTSAMNIIVYADEFTADANYLKAAIDAIQQYTKLAIKVSIVNKISDIKPGTGWLFWLSEKALLQQLPANVFVYEKEKEQEINSWLTTANDHWVNGEQIHLSRFIQNNSVKNNFETIWKDGYGHDLLSLEKKNSNIYHFYSRLNPQWNDLPWSSQFPGMIFNLFIKQKDLKIDDRRMIDAAQLQPQIIKENKTFDKEKFIETIDLTKLFWLLAFIIFFIERYISLTRKSDIYD